MVGCKVGEALSWEVRLDDRGWKGRWVRVGPKQAEELS